MRLRLVRPMRRSGTANIYFEKRIPADLQERLSNKKFVVPLTDDPKDAIEIRLGTLPRSVRFSLRTAVPTEAKRRHAAAIEYFESRFEELRDGKPVTLGHREVTALAGRIYSRYAPWPNEGKPIMVLEGEKGNWTITYEMDEAEEVEHLELSAQAYDEEHNLEWKQREDVEDFARTVELILEREDHLSLAQESALKVGKAVRRALVEGLRAGAKKVGGDYSPDPVAARFPAWEPPKRETPKPSPRPPGGVSLTGLVAGWWKEAQAVGKSESTLESYSNTFRLFSAFLGHDDALRVTPQDVINYKDHRLTAKNPKTGKVVSAKTVKASDLTGLKSVFDWAVANLRVPSNPALGVNVKLGKKVKLRERDFTPEEASAILKAALSIGHKTRLSQGDAAKRWVPWICAYTGCRVGEIAQLRKEDVRREGEAWVITITPEAGPVKNKEVREVPLHAHLVEMGFPDFVGQSKKGYLFLTVKPGKTLKGTLQGRKNRLAEFARTVVKDPNVAPNHGWRHTFKTRGFEANIQEKVLDAICGHAPGTVGRAYGSVTLQTKIEALNALPKFSLNHLYIPNK